MSDRYNALCVTLESDLKGEDCRGIVEAIKCLRGVASVDLVKVEPLEDTIARNRVREQFREKFLALLRETFDDR